MFTLPSITLTPGPWERFFFLTGGGDKQASKKKKKKKAEMLQGSCSWADTPKSTTNKQTNKQTKTRRCSSPSGDVAGVLPVSWQPPPPPKKKVLTSKWGWCRGAARELTTPLQAGCCRGAAHELTPPPPKQKKEKEKREKVLNSKRGCCSWADPPPPPVKNEGHHLLAGMLQGCCYKQNKFSLQNYCLLSFFWGFLQNSRACTPCFFFWGYCNTLSIRLPRAW